MSDRYPGDTRGVGRCSGVRRRHRIRYRRPKYLQTYNFYRCSRCFGRCLHVARQGKQRRGGALRPRSPSI